MSGPAPHWSPQWSIVIPAYNEAIRLPGYLKDVLAYLEGRDEPFEDTGKYMVVHRRQDDGTWAMWLDMFHSDGGA